jgi:hypothetical protein
MDERRKKAFDFAQELCKQLLTLATAVIGLTITFGKDFVGHVSGLPRFLAIISWALFLLSIACGLFTLMALTGSLENVGGQNHPPSIRGRNVTWPAAAQVLLFFVGLVLTVLFGILAGQQQSSVSPLR